MSASDTTQNSPREGGVSAADLLGLWKDDPRTVQEIMDEIRGPR